MEYNGQYWDTIQQTANQYNIDPTMFFNMLAHESMFNPNAVSPKGAQGIAQFTPETAAQFGINPFNPNEAIPAAGKYIRDLLDQFGGRYEHAFAGYNAGPGAVQKHGGIPPFKETQNFVGDITQGVFPPQLQFAPGWQEKVNAVHPMAQGLSGPPPMNTVDSMGPILENVPGIAEQEMAQMAKDAIPSVPLEAVPETAKAMNPFTNPEVLGATKFVEAPGIISQAGQNLTSPLGIAGSLATLATTDWENPESVGSSLGGIAGGALGAPVASAIAGGAGAASSAAAGAAAGSVVPVIGTVVGGIAGGLLGGEVGKLFGGDDKEEEAKKEQKYAFLNDFMSRTAKQNQQYGAERRQGIDRVTEYLNATNKKQPYQWAL